MLNNIELFKKELFNIYRIRIVQHFGITKMSF